MYRPVLFSNGIPNEFRGLSKRVSISIDCCEYDKDADFKVLIQIEPHRTLNVPNNVFDLILGWKEALLELPNSRKFVFGDCWIDLYSFKSDKKNEISLLTSNKNFLPGHNLRHEAFDLLNYGVDGFSVRTVRTPPRIESKHEIFENAKFSVIIENMSYDNYFTEKLVDCLITRTIPIYWGCPNIGEYFDTSGMLIFNDMSELGNILHNLSPDLYDNSLEIIENNYKKSLEYQDFFVRVEKEIENV